MRGFLKLNIGESKRRIWEYFLRKRFGGKMGLERMVEILLLDAVAEEVKKDLEKVQ